MPYIPIISAQQTVALTPENYLEQCYEFVKRGYEFVETNKHKPLYLHKTEPNAELSNKSDISLFCITEVANDDKGFIIAHARCDDPVVANLFYLATCYALVYELSLRCNQNYVLTSDVRKDDTLVYIRSSSEL